MNEQKYSFRPLTQRNAFDWFDVARQCEYATANVLDESLIRRQSEQANAHILVYDTNEERPVAIFPGEIVAWRKGPWRIRALESRFGGLMIVPEHMPHALRLRDFFRTAVVNDHYRHVLKIDYLDVHIPPKITIEQPGFVDKIVPFHCGHVRINSLLYAELKGDLLPTLKYSARRHISKGLKTLQTMQVIRGMNGRMSEHLQQLDSTKASSLNISRTSDDHFERVLQSDQYHALVAVDGERPVAAMIASCCNGVATFHYNTSTEDAKKTFINKGLIYMMMEECRAKGAMYFAMGNGNEDDALGGRDGPKRYNNDMGNLVRFKRSFSTHEVMWCHYVYPLTVMGQLVTSMAQWRAAPNGRSHA